MINMDELNKLAEKLEQYENEKEFEEDREVSD